jgi:hypothetical protein
VEEHFLLESGISPAVTRVTNQFQVLLHELPPEYSVGVESRRGGGQPPTNGQQDGHTTTICKQAARCSSHESQSDTQEQAKLLVKQ